MTQARIRRAHEEPTGVEVEFDVYTSGLYERTMKIIVPPHSTVDYVEGKMREAVIGRGARGRAVEGLVRFLEGRIVDVSGV